MNCQHFENVVCELAREQIIEASTRSKALAHSSSCAQCSIRLADERALTLGLRALAREMESIAVPNRLEGQVLSAYRGQLFAEQVKRPKILKPLVVAAAAAIFIVVGLAGVRVWLDRGGEPIPPIAFVAETGDPILAQPPISDPETTEKPPARNRGTQGTRLKVIRVTAGQAIDKTPRRKDKLFTPASSVATEVSNKKAEVATEFMPLGFVNPMALQEGGQIVRVEFPRSAMLSLGLPVNMDRYGERVKADVLVGADGLARAIRFLQ